MAAMQSRLNPDTFMSKVLSKHLQELSGSAEGTLVFRFTGDAPSEWTVNMNRRRVERGGVAERDVFIEMTGTTLREILLYGSPLSAPEGAIHIEGNRDKLIELAAFIQDIDPTDLSVAGHA